ncbi:hypothetical protein H1C71_027016 [Ictidomys tridecemlineatus]|nr:hypothetical protein H1C71_027016 [Ictidomys tridecemlineatus]
MYPEATFPRTRADRWVSLLCEQLGRGSPRREEPVRSSLRGRPVPGAVPVTPCKVAPQAGRLRSPPRASVYLIIGLQNELIRCGILKNMSDHEEFWKLVQEEGHGTEIKEKLQKIKEMILEEMTEKNLNAGLDRNSPNPGSQQQEEQKQGLLSQVTEWRKRCQQREDAGRLGRRAPGQGKIACKTGEKDSRSKIYLRRLYQMYSTSLANMEFSRRLMERDGRFADEHAERRAGGLVSDLGLVAAQVTLCPAWDGDLGGSGELAFLWVQKPASRQWLPWRLDFMVPNEDTGQEEVQPREMGTEDPPPIGRQPGAWPALRFLKCQSLVSAQRAPHRKTGGRQVALCGMRHLAEHVKGEPAPPGMATAPLALEHMVLTHRVVEAKTGSRYWINYVVEE